MNPGDRANTSAAPQKSRWAVALVAGTKDCTLAAVRGASRKGGWLTRWRLEYEKTSMPTDERQALGLEETPLRRSIK